MKCAVMNWGCRRAGGEDDGTSTSQHFLRAHQVAVLHHTPHAAPINTQNCSAKQTGKTQRSKVTHPKSHHQNMLEGTRNPGRRALLLMPLRAEVVTGCPRDSKLLYFHFGAFVEQYRSKWSWEKSLTIPPKDSESLAVTFPDP